MRKTGIESIDRAQVTLDALQSRSDEAKGLVGKLISLQHADGYAYYTVEGEKPKELLLKWHDILDGWHDSVLGNGGWFPRKQIEPIIRSEDGMRSLMQDHGNKVGKARAARAASVVAAALADLGPDPDIFALAHWCFERGHRQPLFMKDKRIVHDKKVLSNGPCADDLAHDLFESKKFPALKKLKCGYTFTSLADGHEDPLLYKKAPPDKEQILAKVHEAFRGKLGVTSGEFDLVNEEEREDLTSTSFLLMAPGGRIGGVSYDVKTGAVLSMYVEFEHEFQKRK